MIARLLVVVGFVVGFTALALTYGSPSPQVAQAQSGDEDLIATIEALQTQVADQEERLTELEDTQKALLLILALGNASEGLPVTPTPTPRPTQRPEPTEHTITGDVLLALPTQYVVEGGTSCKAVTLYKDIGYGAGISIYSWSGNFVGQTVLGRGVVTNKGCAFPFSIEVADQEFYRFVIADHQVGLFSKPTMVSAQWDIEIVIHLENIN